jgi:hypothetical protein
MSTTDLRRALEADLSAVVSPPGDLTRALREGRRIQRRRRGAFLAGGAACVAAAVLLSAQLIGGSSRPVPVEPLGRLDFSQGLRAYAAPGAEIHLGGRSFPASRLEYLDTDATATPFGVVFYDAGIPRLLDETGRVTDLEPTADTSSAHPTAKMDARGPLVAYGAVLEGQSTVVVRDLAAGRDVARHQVSRGTVIDALDDGVVFLRDEAGTSTWDTGTDEVRPFAGPKTRVADVRNGVVLYDGPEPDGQVAGLRLVPGPIDGQLSFDGAHVLSWSSRLESTDGGKSIVLEQGPTKRGALGFWAVDTDGSVLVAALSGKYPHYTVYDCELPSGHCAELGPLITEHGDPMFIGVDM